MLDRRHSENKEEGLDPMAKVVTFHIVRTTVWLGTGAIGKLKC